MTRRPDIGLISFDERLEMILDGVEINIGVVSFVERSEMRLDDMET